MNDTFEGHEFDYAEGSKLFKLIEQDRTRPETPEMTKFRKWFSSVNSPYLAAGEFMCLGVLNADPDSPCYRRNSMPSEDIWNSAISLINAMNAVAKELGSTIHITNCFRNHSYNAKVGGASGSQHILFQAADWVALDGNSGDWADAAQTVRDRGDFSGGIGIYPGFVHVDVRGQQVDWDHR